MCRDRLQERVDVRLPISLHRLYRVVDVLNQLLHSGKGLLVCLYLLLQELVRRQSSPVRCPVVLIDHLRELLSCPVVQAFRQVRLGQKVKLSLYWVVLARVVFSPSPLSLALTSGRALDELSNGSIAVTALKAENLSKRGGQWIGRGVPRRKR